MFAPFFASAAHAINLMFPSSVAINYMAAKVTTTCSSQEHWYTRTDCYLIRVQACEVAAANKRRLPFQEIAKEILYDIQFLVPLCVNIPHTFIAL